MDLYKLHVDDNVFVPEPEVGGGSRAKARASWKVEGNASFALEVDIVEGVRAALVIGIVPAGTTFQSLIRRKTLSSCSDLAWYRLNVSIGKLLAFDRDCRVSGLDLTETRRIKLEYLAGEDPKLLYSVNNGIAIDVTAQLPRPLRAGAYKPCITIGDSSLRIKCSFTGRSLRGRLEGAAFAAKTSRDLWEQRKYTDVVVCATIGDGRRIPCHRAQLAVGSPVFAAELERWTNAQQADATPEVDVHAEGAVVEAMLEFLYTGELSSASDVAAVLPLAHRYQVDDLVSLAAERVLEGLTPENAVSVARSLRPFRDEEGLLREAWYEFNSRASADSGIVEALALAA